MTVTDEVPKPRPEPTPVSQPFWDALRDERIELQRCDDCGRWVYYPRSRCPSCLSDRLTWTPVDGDGTVYTAGTAYDVPVEGRYWSAFDRSNPIDAAVREQAWTGTAHALIGELGVGTATASALQLGLGLAALFAGVGATFFLAGAGLVWAARPETEKVPVLRPAGVAV